MLERVVVSVKKHLLKEDYNSTPSYWTMFPLLDQREALVGKGRFRTVRKNAAPLGTRSSSSSSNGTGTPCAQSQLRLNNSSQKSTMDTGPHTRDFIMWMTSASALGLEKKGKREMAWTLLPDIVISWSGRNQ